MFRRRHITLAHRALSRTEIRYRFDITVDDQRPLSQGRGRKVGEAEAKGNEMFVL